MKQSKGLVRLISGGLVTLALVGVAVAAGQQGSKNDPLVTLSYLEDQAIPAILDQVDDKMADKQSELEKKLSDVVDGYVDEVEKALSGSSGSTSAGGVFQIVLVRRGAGGVAELGQQHAVGVGGDDIANGDAQILRLRPGCAGRDGARHQQPALI